MELNDLTEKIIGAAHKVLFALKPGLDEKLYERALIIELNKQGLRCDSQRQFDVLYDGQCIGTLVPDLIIEDLVIVDPKVVTAFNDTHLAQMLATSISPGSKPPFFSILSMQASGSNASPTDFIGLTPSTLRAMDRNLTTERTECTEREPPTPNQASFLWFDSVHSVHSVVKNSEGIEPPTASIPSSGRTPCIPSAPWSLDRSLTTECTVCTE